MKFLKLNKNLRNFDMIRHEFSSSTKRKNTFLYLFCFELKEKIERNKPKTFFGDYLDTENPVWINLSQIQ